MSVTKYGLFAILAVFLVEANLEGGLVAPQSIVTLQQSADLIIIASANDAVPQGTAVNVSLNIIRVIKGDPALTGTSIAAYWATGNRAAPDLNGSGIWFLQLAGSVWRVIPVIQGTMQLSRVYFPAPPTILNAYSYNQSASLSDKLASEIASAIESNNGFNFQLYALQSGVLDELQSPIVAVLYGRMAHSTSTEHKLLGLSGLIRSGNAAALTTALQTASVSAGDPAAGVLLLSIRDYFRATDADSVAALGEAATSSSNSNVPLREAAGHALAAIHTTAALPFLVTLLNDSDVNLRVEAVGGMGAFANGLGVQTRGGNPSLSHLQLPANAPYKTDSTVANLAFGVQAVTANESSYISFWKSWWAQNRVSMGY